MRLTDRGLNHIADNLPKLTVLCVLGNTLFSIDGFKELATKHPNLVQLKIIGKNSFPIEIMRIGGELAPSITELVLINKEAAIHEAAFKAPFLPPSSQDDI